jgi:hypothetical protein
MTNADGTVGGMQRANGTITSTAPDGTTTAQAPDGTVIYTFRDGTMWHLLR